MTHRLLERQLKKVGLDQATPPILEVWQQFLSRVDRAYTQSDQDRALLERSLNISSREMKELNESLRRSSESRLAEERDKLEAVINSLGEGLCALDPAGHLIFINLEGERLLGWKESELIGQPVLDMVVVRNKSEQRSTTSSPSLQELIDVRQAYRNEDGYFLRKDGKTIPVSYLLNPLTNNDTVFGVVLVFRDITERKQTEVERERLLAEIEAAYRQYVKREWEQHLSEHQGRLRIEHRIADPAQEWGSNGNSGATISAPISLRGQAIGKLDLQDIDPNRKWMAEEKVLIETVAEQLALTVENLRLFEDTRRNAWRDRVVSESTANVWSSSEIEEVMKAAVVELGDKLQASEVVIRLGTEEVLTQQ